MKKTFFKGLSLLVIASIFFHLLSCGSGSEEQNETDSTAFDQEAYKQQVEGIYEYLSPYQGLAFMYEGEYIYIYGKNDSTMYSHAGTYQILGDTVKNNVVFAMDSLQEGTSFTWKSFKLGGDTILAEVFNDKGEVIESVHSLKKFSVTKETIENKHYLKGVWKFAPPLNGKVIFLDKYFIQYGFNDTIKYSSTGHYIENGDTVTSTRIFALNQENNTNRTWTIKTIDNEKYLAVFDQNGNAINEKFKISKIK